MGKLSRSLPGLIAVVALLFCLSPAVHAEAPAEYDGYLVSIPARAALFDAAPAASETDGLTLVAPELYLAETAAQAAALLDAGIADYIEPNYLVTLFDDGPDKTAPADWAGELLNTAYAAALGLTGRGVRVGIIDSGLDPENANLAAAHVATGYDYLGGSRVMSDTRGHGTYIAQILAGCGSGGAVYGVVPDVEIVPLRCFSRSSGSIATTIRAIRDAVDVYHCDIINMSWGTTASSQSLANAVRYAYESGAVLVAAAGNVSNSTPQGSVFYPAAYAEVIGVGALGRDWKVSSSSQQTAAVEVCAPGVEIPFLRLDSDEIYAGSGTSYAAPYVTAVLALICQETPLDGAPASALLRERAVDLGESGRDDAYGYGLVRTDMLLYDSWRHAEIRDGVLTVVGWQREAANARAAAALYDANGRMTGCALTETRGALGGYRLSCRADSPAEVSLFFWDRDAVPLTKKFQLETSGPSGPSEIP